MTMKEFKRKLTRDINILEVELSSMKPTPYNYTHYVTLQLTLAIYKDMRKMVDL